MILAGNFVKQVGTRLIPCGPNDPLDGADLIAVVLEDILTVTNGSAARAGAKIQTYRRQSGVVVEACDLKCCHEDHHVELGLAAVQEVVPESDPEPVAEEDSPVQESPELPVDLPNEVTPEV